MVQVPVCDGALAQLHERTAGFYSQVETTATPIAGACRGEWVFEVGLSLNRLGPAMSCLVTDQGSRFSIEHISTLTSGGAAMTQCLAASQ